MTQKVLVNRQRSSSVLKEFRADPVGFLRLAAQAEGPAAGFRIGGRSLTLLKDPQHIEEVLVKQQGAFRKGPGLLRLRPVLGEGLLTADGPRHLANRRRLQPAFSASKITEYGELVPAIVTRHLSEWRNGDSREILGEMAHLALNVVSSTLFSSGSLPDHEVVSAAIANNQAALYRPLTKCPHMANMAMSSRADIDEVVRVVIDGHSPSQSSDDFLSLLGDSDLSASEQQDEGATFLLGGHESVSVALAWIWYVLSQNHSVRATFEEEIDQIDPGQLTSDLLPYTRKVIAEVLRLYPPAWMLSRESMEPVVVGGEKYSAGAILIVAPCVTHRDPRYWPRPDVFDPSRWDSAHSAIVATTRFRYFPFGGGVRRCIGEQFALTELPIVLASIGQQWRLDPAPGAPPPLLDPVVTLRPLGGLTMVLTER